MRGLAAWPRFTLAQRARWAAAIRARVAAEKRLRAGRSRGHQRDRLPPVAWEYELPLPTFEFHVRHGPVPTATAQALHSNWAWDLFLQPSQLRQGPRL